MSKLVHSRAWDIFTGVVCCVVALVCAFIYAHLVSRLKKKGTEMIQIEKVQNGYILQKEHVKYCFETLEALMAYLLMAFEGRSVDLGGGCYGRVIIERKPDGR